MEPARWKMGAGVATGIAVLGTLSLISDPNEVEFTPLFSVPTIEESSPEDETESNGIVESEPETTPETEGVVEQVASETPGLVAVASLDGPIEMTLMGAEKDIRRDELAARNAILFCFPDAVKGGVDGCTDRVSLLAGNDQPMDWVTADGRPRFAKVLLVHPTDFLEPEREVKTCSNYAELKSIGWGPLSTADRINENWFLRYCGLMSIARYADVARTSKFDADALNADELSMVRPLDWPVIGERRGKPFEPIIIQNDDDPRLWEADSPFLIVRVRDIAHADFDGDGEGERLIYLSARARAGSAGFSHFGLLDHKGDYIRLRPIKWRTAINGE